MTWNTPTAWLANPAPAFRSRAALHLSTSPGYAKPGVISPRQIARGRSDRFLLEMNRNLTLSGRIFYIRVMGEPNGYWNAYAPYDRDGTFRGVQNAPRFYRQAWRRTVLILRGGPTTVINRRLRALGLPSLQVRPTSRCSSKSSHAVPRATRCQPALPRPKVAFLWVPQDAGSPDIAANAPSVFWPGGAYVDWVGTDFYASYPNFSLLDRFYSKFPGKPFVISEWALFGSDDPRFVRSLFSWARAHSRLRMMNYYQGFSASNRANLAHYPNSRRVLQAELRSSRYPPYAPEYAHSPPAT